MESYFSDCSPPNPTTKIPGKSEFENFPIKEQFGNEIRQNLSNFGYWVASRDIKAGEQIFKEAPILIAPRVAEKESDFRPVCLGCNKILPGGHKCPKCPKCNWPLCSKFCEHLKRHEDNECQIFRKNKVFITNPILDYQFIPILRLLMKKRPKTWEKLMKLPIDKYEDDEDFYESACNFINNECKLTQIDPATIVLITKIWETNKTLVGDDNFKDNLRTKSEAFLSYYTSKIDYSCNVNIQQSPLNENTNSRLYGVEYKALRDIKEGERVTFTFIDNNGYFLNTEKRRQAIYHTENYICKCQRCSDPTEMKTNFSSVKCPSCNKGYLVPVPANSVQLQGQMMFNFDTIYSCTSCMASKSLQAVNFIIEPYISNFKKVFVESETISLFLPRGDYLTSEHVKAICNLNLLLTSSTEYVHPDYYLNFQLRQNLMAAICSVFIAPRHLIINVLEEPQRIWLMNLIEELSNDCLRITKLIMPGRSEINGKILCYKAVGKWAKIIENLNADPTKKNSESVKNLISEAEDFSKEAEICSGKFIEIDPIFAFLDHLNFFKSSVKKFLENN